MKTGGDRRADARCSFCGKGEDQVRKLIAGPGVFICDECIDLSREAIDADNHLPRTEAEPQSAPDPPAHLFGLTARELQLAILFAHGLGIDAISCCMGFNSRAVGVALIRAYTKMSGPSSAPLMSPDRPYMSDWLDQHGLLPDRADSAAVVLQAMSALENVPDLPAGLSSRERKHLERHLAAQKAVLAEALRALSEPPATED
jgi:hypothetical protein